MLLRRRRWIIAATAAAAGAATPLLVRAGRDGAGTPSPAAATPMLATEAAAGIDPRGWLVSEKLDGVRAHWDGRELRLRGGGVVATPPDFCAGWPVEPIDGELWAGRGGFERVVGTVRRATPQLARWGAVRFCAFDLPTSDGPFEVRATRLAARVAASRATGLAGTLHAVTQERLPDAAALRRRLAEVVAAGGEGLVLHRADARWEAGRSQALLKLKPVHDAEATVIAHEPGQGRLAGRMGALRVRTPEGREFRIGSGFSDDERAWPPPVGSVVTYRHRGHTDAGVPRFATYLRRRPPGS